MMHFLTLNQNHLTWEKTATTELLKLNLITWMEDMGNIRNVCTLAPSGGSVKNDSNCEVLELLYNVSCFLLFSRRNL